MDKICVYTCITGNYDTLKEIEKIESGVDYICFTNNKNLRSKTWEIIPIQNNGLDDIRLARQIKILGHDRLEEYESTVWLDAAIRFETNIKNFIQQYTDLKNKPFAAFTHHENNGIYEEAMDCIKRQKDKKETILNQLKRYEQEQIPLHDQIFVTGCLIRNMHDKKVQETMKLWFQMVKDYSVRDQLSCNYAIYKKKLETTRIDLNIFATKHLTWIEHCPQQKKLQNYRIYFGNETVDYRPEYDIQGPYQVKGEDWYECRVTIPRSTDIASVTLNCSSGYSLSWKTIKLSVGQVEEIEPTIAMNQREVFIKSPTTMKLSGPFKQGCVLKLAFQLKQIDCASLINYYESQVALLEAELRQEQDAKIFWKREAQHVINSKLWKIAQPIRQLTEKVKQGK